jgi:hypothetical protein
MTGALASAPAHRMNLILVCVAALSISAASRGFD